MKFLICHTEPGSNRVIAFPLERDGVIKRYKVDWDLAYRLDHMEIGEDISLMSDVIVRIA